MRRKPGFMLIALLIALLADGGRDHGVVEEQMEVMR